jgi:hypothetical protein
VQYGWEDGVGVGVLAGELRGQRVQSRRSLGDRTARVDVVEDVVGAAGEAVERVDRRTLVGGE